MRGKGGGEKKKENTNRLWGSIPSFVGGFWMSTEMGQGRRLGKKKRGQEGLEKWGEYRGQCRGTNGQLNEKGGNKGNTRGKVEKKWENINKH